MGGWGEEKSSLFDASDRSASRARIDEARRQLDPDGTDLTRAARRLAVKVRVFEHLRTEYARDDMFKELAIFDEVAKNGHG